MLRRASEIFLGSEQKSLVKASLSYISAERHDLRCLHRDGEDTLDIELKWCVSDHVEEARKQKLLAIDLGKSLHTFEHVAVGIDVLQESCSERGEEKAVRVSLETTTREPKLDTVTFHSLGTGSEALSLHLVLGDSEIADIQRIRVQEGAQLSFFKWIDNFSFAGLTQLDCSCCGIGVFPESLGELGQQLRSLNLSQNKLVELPNKVVRKLIKLEVLIASHNALTALPASLSTLMMLETLNLEDNRLTTIICPFNKLIRLKRLLLKGNSLLYLPPLVGNTTLQELSIANLVIRGNVAEEHPGGGEDCLDSHQLKYEGVATIFSETTSFLTPLKKAMLSNKWIPFFDLFVGRSEAHPLVLSAILQAFEDKEACEYVASQERGVLQQLVLLTLSNDVDVVKRSSQCLISAFSKCDIMDRLLENNMQQCVSTLLGSEKVIDQEAGIKLLSHITFTSDQFSRHIFSDTILTLLANITCKQAMKWMTRERKVSHLSAPKSESEFKENLFGLDICGKALECMGNLALSVENREKMAGNDALLNAIEMVISLGNKFIAKERGIEVLLGKKSSNGSPRKEAEREKRLLRSREISDSAGICVRCALRVMAILGLNQKLDDILHSVAGKRRGIRILSIDGGGSKGRCALEMCRVMERKTGKLICDLFDLIVGTSTGSIIAMGLGALAMRVEEVEEAYDTLTTVFKNSQGKNSDSGWVAEMSSLYIAGTQNIRALFKGCMYNHELLEDFYKRWAKIPDVVDDERFCAFSRSMINLAPLGRPRVACVASLTNVAR
ncbi:patatin-like phospholipase [Chloropicon primus]|nr:patatin-like phospholipase [Chloropicon primus]